MKALLINGSPHPKGCTYTALEELARTLEAEGIETDSQIELLKQLGCDRLQGFKIGKPAASWESACTTTR